MPFSVPERNHGHREYAGAAPHVDAAVCEARGGARQAEGGLRPSQVPVPGEAAEQARPQAEGGGVAVQRARRLRPSGAPARPSSVSAQQVREVLRGPGEPLAAPVKEDMEARLAADFSTVRVHADSAARASAAEFGARAYTVGEHVVVGDGDADKQVLAHELAHVIQQRQGPVAGTRHGNFSLSHPGDVHERAAEATARRAMSGAGPQPAAVEPNGHRSVGTPSATGAPTIQRVVVVGKSEFKAPDDTKSGDYKNEEARFRNDVLGPVLAEYQDRDNSDKDIAGRISALLQASWRQGRIEAGSISELTDKALAELSNRKRRPTRTEREVLRGIEVYDRGTQSDKTRGGKPKQEERKRQVGGELTKLATPKKRTRQPRYFVGKDKKRYLIHKGSRNFKPAFTSNYWGAFKKWSGEKKLPVRCVKCHEPMKLNNKKTRTIDHNTEYSKLKTAVDTYIVCDSKEHWEVTKQDDVDVESHDGSPDGTDLAVTTVKGVNEKGKSVLVGEINRKNLRPMHRKCNSGKGGSKESDSIAPVPKGKCPALQPGGKCDALKVADTGKAKDEVDAATSDDDMEEEKSGDDMEEEEEGESGGE